MYQIDIMARLTFVVIFLTSSRLRQSKSSFEDQKRFSNYPRWTWIIAKSLHLLLLHRFFPSMKSGQAKIDLLFTYIQLATGNLSRLPFIRAIENILTNCLQKADKTWLRINSSEGGRTNVELVKVAVLPYKCYLALLKICTPIAQKLSHIRGLLKRAKNTLKIWMMDRRSLLFLYQ